MLQIEKQAKNYTIEEKYYEYKNIVRNRKRCDNNYIYNTLNESIKSISNYKSFEKKERD